MPLRRFPLLVLAALLSCNGPGLEGSLAEAFDLSYTAIEVRQSPKGFQVSYLKSEGREVVIRLTVATEALTLTGGKTVALDGEYAPGHPRTTVVRAIDGEPLRTLPSVSRGTLDLDSTPSEGKLVSGSFSLAFGEGGDVGAGRTLVGNFSGVVLPAP